MGRLLSQRSIGGPDHASEQGQVLAFLRSTAGQNFTAAIAKNGMATANLAGLASNDIVIRSVSVQCTFPLKFRMLLFGDSKFTNADLSLDRLLASTQHNLVDLGELGILKDSGQLHYALIYSGAEGGPPSFDAVATDSALCRVYSAGAGNTGMQYQVVHPPLDKANFAAWNVFQGDAAHVTLIARCDWGYDNLGNKRFLAYHYEQEAAGRRVHELVLDEDGAVISSSQVQTGWGAGLDRFFAFAARHDPAGSINSPTMMVECNSNAAASNEMRAYIKPWGGAFQNASAPTALDSSPYVVLDIDIVHYSEDTWAIFYIGYSAGEYAIFRVLGYSNAAYSLSWLQSATVTKIYSSHNQVGRPSICKVGKRWRLQFERWDLWDKYGNGNHQLVTLIADDLLANTWTELPELTDLYAYVNSPYGVVASYLAHTALIIRPGVVYAAAVNQHVISGLRIPYHDREELERLHVGLVNLSPTTKRAYPLDELVVDIGYERAA